MTLTVDVDLAEIPSEIEEEEETTEKGCSCGISGGDVGFTGVPLLFGLLLRRRRG